MTKDEVLKMAIEWMDKWHDKKVIVINVGQRWVDFSMPITACKEALETPVCNPHPDAPHGFCRDASHSAGRYVCECEGWEFEWQGLTDDDLTKICEKYWDSENGHSIKDIILMVQQALKEKNT